eukprot:CAMPEP_0170603992 /NCGR_PEP_ID=MMETSP0224-20130122/19194_1 /TAXON_ID=285029 /ORGANISM="Togula jolla, Strain CCCM 725" /LENGTH=252 /DNA_ID=CAMNT_0010928883 /DNA_START=45 /DNA_END=803 /DNA_ORIENTATION=+
MDPSRRIRKEFEKMRLEAIAGIEAAPSEDLFRWTAQIDGPEGSPYEGGVFQILLKLPSRYPLEPPQVRFSTRIFHPNVDERGNVCLDILKNQWSPALSLQKVLLSLSSLLTDPNFADPLNRGAAELHRRDRAGYDRMCRDLTRQFATENFRGNKRKVTEESTTEKPPSLSIPRAPAGVQTPTRPSAKAQATAKATAKAKAKAKAKVKGTATARSSASKGIASPKAKAKARLKPQPQPKLRAKAKAKGDGACA